MDWIFIIILIVVLIVLALFGIKKYEFELEPKNAICILQNQEGNVESGVVKFQQISPELVKITGVFNNFIPGEHGIHIHQYGDLSNGCTSTGGHYNKNNTTHGNITSKIRHSGDLGNITIQGDGTGRISIVDDQIRVKEILGRSLVIHSDSDDFGLGGHPDSKINGHSGSRIACGVISLSSSAS